MQASNTVTAGAEAGDKADTTGCRGTPRAWQSVLGREQAGSHPRSALPAETGHRHSWWGGHLEITINHEVSQISVEKFKGAQFYNLEETANTLNDTNIKILQVAVTEFTARGHSRDQQNTVHY